MFLGGKMKAKIYDFDPLWDIPQGTDETNTYVIREVDKILKDGSLILKNGTLSTSYCLLEEKE